MNVIGGLPDWKKETPRRSRKESQLTKVARDDVLKLAGVYSHAGGQTQGRSRRDAAVKGEGVRQLISCVKKGLLKRGEMPRAGGIGNHSAMPGGRKSIHGKRVKLSGEISD